jgi:hypothetical protein
MRQACIPNRALIRFGSITVASHPSEAQSVPDLVFLALGLGAFALLALYARWAAGA